MKPIISADTSELLRMRRNFLAEREVSRRSGREIIAHKAEDTRINLGKEFYKHRFLKGKKAASSGDQILKSILKHGGINVRLMNLVSPWAGMVPTVDKNGKPLSLWQKLVAQETLRRMSGSGVLGVSFWAKRKGKRVDPGTGKVVLLENKTKGFGRAVTIEMDDSQATITGFTPGLAKVAIRYGAIPAALRKVNAASERYLMRKYRDEFAKQMAA
jgi:hypothetical protein